MNEAWEALSFDEKVAELEKELMKTEGYDPVRKELVVNGKKVRFEFLNEPKRLRTWPWSKPARRLGDYHGGILRNGRIRIYEAALSSKEKALHTVHHEIKHAKDYSGLGYLKDMLKYGVAGMLSSLGTACVEITALNYLNRLDIVQQLYKTGLNPVYLALITVPLVGLAAGKRLADKRFAENEILADRYADKRMEELGYVRSVDE